jgi:hypothetical protein
LYKKIEKPYIELRNTNYSCFLAFVTVGKDRSEKQRGKQKIGSCQTKDESKPDRFEGNGKKLTLAEKQ